MNNYYGLKNLSSEEIRAYFIEFKKGDKNARDELIKNNIKLVIARIKKYLNNYDEYDDLLSVGIIGLIRAVDSFDLNRNVEFSTYAYRCIDNEIFMYKKNNNEKFRSLNETINNEELTLEDILESDINIIEDYENIILNKMIKEIIDELPQREKNVVQLRYGLLDNTSHKIKEIANIIGVSNGTVHSLNNKSIKYIKNRLESFGEVIRTNDEVKIKVKKMPMQRPKMEIFYNNLVDIINEFIYSESKTKFDPIFIKDLDILKTKSFNKLIDRLPTVDGLIIRMKLGYQGKYYSTNEVANLFGISNDEVIYIIKNTLHTYKKYLNKQLEKLSNNKKLIKK